MAASSLVDLVKVTVTSSGTGPFILGQAVSGYRGREALSNGATYSYSVQQGDNYEVGRGVYLSTDAQLVRTPLFSSNGGAAVNFEISATVAFTALAEDLQSDGTAAANEAAARAMLAADQAAADAEIVQTIANTGVGRVELTWAQLTALTGQEGDGAIVADSDTGTHTDPVTGTSSVPNAGIYRYQASSPAGWQRIAPSTAGLVAEASAAAVAAAALVGTVFRVDDNSFSDFMMTWQDNYGCLRNAMFRIDGRLLLTGLALPFVVDDDSSSLFVETWQDSYGCFNNAQYRATGYPLVVSPSSGSMQTILPNSPQITRDGALQYYQLDSSGYIPSRPFTSDGGPGASMQYDAPCARVAWESTADAIEVDVEFLGTVNGQSDTTSPAPFGASLLIDGVKAVGLTTSVAAGSTDAQTFSATGLGTDPKIVEVIHPGGVAMKVVQIRQTAGAAIQPAPTPARRIVGQIDSLTHWRTVPEPEKWWFFLHSRRLDLEPINLGYSGRQLSTNDGTLAGSVARAKIITGFSGPNEYQNGQYSPTVFGQKVTTYMGEVFAVAPADAHLVMISQIWCGNDGANPANGTGTANGLGFKPHDYRVAFQNAVTAYASAHPEIASRLHLVPGLTLVTNNASRYVSDQLHLNEIGAAEFDANLATTTQSLVA